MNSLSPIALTARVADFETGIIHDYPALYAENAAKLNNPRGIRMRDLEAYEHERQYWIIWDNGVTAYYRSRQAPSQITPNDIERAFAGAKLLKSGEVR